MTSPITHHAPKHAALAQVRVGSAPDSWGVWFPDDPRQVHWSRFLDEIAEAGYEWLELGPYGYLPTDPAALAAELGQRGLKMSAGTVGGALHRAEEYAGVREEALRVAGLAAAAGASYLVFLPAMYRDLMTGASLEPAELDADGWKRLTGSVEELARTVCGEHGVRLLLHPHADSHVETQAQTERFLSDTDPALVGLCLDTGHIAYRRGDNAELLRRFPERVEYVHFKQVDPVVLDEVERENLPFAEAVTRGAVCEPPKGVPSLESLADGLAGLAPDVFVIVEQDMYPCPPDQPLPIATRTCGYLRGSGLGSAARRAGRG
ncbi:TIM barrel protein [Streptomyces sp. NPDC096132]|uniref:TIM barrel protein n=1 Tax=Streptomyces sp. NPDC096132 TaxID=3366075 RepID=UPI0037F5E38B